MKNEKITVRAAISVAALFIGGISIFMLPNKGANRDMWMVPTMAVVLFVPQALLFGRLVQLQPDKDPYEMFLDAFGKVAGVAIGAVFALYSIHLAALIIRTFTEFIQISTNSSHPQYFYGTLFMALCIWSMKGSRDTVMRASIFLVPLLTAIYVVSFLSTFGMWKPHNITPMLDTGLAPLLDAAASTWGFPLAETVLLLFLIKPLEDTRRAYRAFLIPAVLIAVLASFSGAVYVMVLGYAQIEKYYFPAYQFYSLINVRDFIQGIQVPLLAIFMIGALVKCSCCLYVTAHGLGKLFARPSHDFAAPVGFIMLVLSFFISASTADVFDFSVKYYKFYIIPISIVIPTLLWSRLEWKNHRAKQKAPPPPASPDAQPAPAVPDASALNPSVPPERTATVPPDR